MIEFLNPLLLGGLAAVTAPVIIHLLHRRRIKPVDWGAMRFLLELVAQRRRRLFLDELLLLLVRVLLVTCVALAMVRPAFLRSSLQSGGGLVRQGAAASVLLIDDSVSSTAGRAQPAFENMRKLGLAYLESLARGDEVSVLLMSQVGAPAGDPIFDLDGLKAHLLGLKPSFVATDIPLLLDAGLGQLKRHVNPGAELVLLTDGRRDGWHEDDKVRWDELRERLRGPAQAIPGSRTRPRVLVLAPPLAAIDDNLAITEVGMDRTLLSAGRAAGLRVAVANFGKQPNREASVQLAVNGQVIGSKRLSLPLGGPAEAVFDHVFDAPGSYSLEATLLDNADLLAADDRRALSVQVEASVPVLLVDGGSPNGLASKLGFLALALDPDPKTPGPFRVTRISLAQFVPSMLQDCRVLVLGDVPVLEPAMVDALERFVVAGGGVLVGLGPNSDLALINRYWAREGEGFLPCPLAAPMTPAKPPLPAGLRLGHPVFNGFGSRSDEAWKAAPVKSYFQLETRKAKGGELDTLLTLDNSDALVVERRRGLGLVTLVSTSLNADWTDLPLQAAYVPLLRGIVGRLGSFVMPPRNLLPGDQIIYSTKVEAAKPIQGEDPSGKPMKLTVGSWEGRDAILSEPLMEPGVYLLRDPRFPAPIRYAVACAPAESALLPMPDRELGQALGDGAPIFHTAEQIAENLDPARRQSVELWKWFLAGAIGLMFAEAWLTRREAGAAHHAP